MVHHSDHEHQQQHHEHYEEIGGSENQSSHNHVSEDSIDNVKSKHQQKIESGEIHSSEKIR